MLWLKEGVYVNPDHIVSIKDARGSSELYPKAKVDMVTGGPIFVEVRANDLIARLSRFHSVIVG